MIDSTYTYYQQPIYFSIESSIALAYSLGVTDVETGSLLEWVFTTFADFIHDFFTSHWNFTSYCILGVYHIRRDSILCERPLVKALSKRFVLELVADCREALFGQHLSY